MAVSCSGWLKSQHCLPGKPQTELVALQVHQVPEQKNLPRLWDCSWIKHRHDWNGASVVTVTPQSVILSLNSCYFVPKLKVYFKVSREAAAHMGTAVWTKDNRINASRTGAGNRKGDRGHCSHPSPESSAFKNSGLLRSFSHYGKLRGKQALRNKRKTLCKHDLRELHSRNSWDSFLKCSPQPGIKTLAFQTKQDGIFSETESLDNSIVNIYDITSCMAFWTL